MKKETVVVGLSGGVDSSVAAYLLKEEGYDVIGLFMKNWHDESVTLSAECPWLEDSNDAMIVAEKLGIPFQTIDLSAEYKTRIVDYMFAEYQRGRTPNPDVLCNREIKFDVFLEIALSLGADFVATGHYCQKSSTVVHGTTVHQLMAGADPNKDQSYFLCQLSQAQLSRHFFLSVIYRNLRSEPRQCPRFDHGGKERLSRFVFYRESTLARFLQQQLAQDGRHY